MKKKNILMMALSLVLVAVIAVGATLAYFTDKTDAKQNVFTTGNVAIEIVDETNGPTEGDTWQADTSRDDGIDYTHVMPGDTISKEVGVTIGADSEDCWVALKLDIAATPDQAYTEADALTAEQAVAAVQALVDKQLEGNANWKAEEGIYYYQSTLSASDAAKAACTLFEGLEIPTEWGNPYANIQFSITVQAAAVQAANVADAAAAQPELAKLFVEAQN